MAMKQRTYIALSGFLWIASGTFLLSIKDSILLMKQPIPKIPFVIDGKLFSVLLNRQQLF